MQKNSFINKSKPIIVQGIFAVIIGILIVGNSAITDHVFFDFYVKPTIARCYAENQEDFCMERREAMGLPSDAHLELGNIYWYEVARQSIFIGVILFLIKLFSSLTLHYFSGMRRIQIIDIYLALIFGLSASLIFIGGFIDFGYYFVQDQPVPSQLPWLNDTGIFAHTQGIFGDKNTVDDLDLYASILITFGVIAFLWLFAMVWFSTTKVKRLI